jgi:hypothetical protein
VCDNRKDLLVLPLDNPSADLNEVGGKGTSLAQLKTTGPTHRTLE